ncbi:MAG: hypothetical protein IPK18_12120 [Sphingobacteriales bacterium]|jgi:hypothetical protein|nr:MAG: hypothetical protein IPK18_12120 [Sphingobacteriales bacterium]
MKQVEINFDRPIKLFQVFRNINIYDKSQKSFDDRKNEMNWTDFHSKTGYVSNNELYLPECILNNSNFKNCDLIILEDNKQAETLVRTDTNYTKISNSNNEYIYCFRTTQNNKYHIFEIKENTSIDLHLLYNYFEIGIPERENHKLCEIKINKPIEIKINGKTDFSMSSRRARMFKEQNYIINYIGDFNKCKILQEPYQAISKQVPNNRKIIDLNKSLW